jgi:hypothetical protein
VTGVVVFDASQNVQRLVRPIGSKTFPAA